MDNPYLQKQAELLQRVVSSAEKCNEAIDEVNTTLRNIIEANADAEVAAEIFAIYRKLVRDGQRQSGIESSLKRSVSDSSQAHSP